jgi:hypothetical protein
MSGYPKTTDALLERRRNVGQEILEFPVVQLTLSQRKLPLRKSYNRYSYSASIGNNCNVNC